MRRTEWTWVAGVGVAGLLLAAPPAWAKHHEGKMGASGSAEKGEGGTASGSSEARGSGQAGESTGARPGEVTGAPEAAGGTSEKEQRAAAAAENEVSGTVEKYDREKRTLSLSNSDKKLKLTDDTQLMKDGNRVSPGQLMEGDEVRASYSGSGDEVEVVTVEILSAASPPREGAAPGPTESGAGTETKGGSPEGTAPGKASETGSGSTGVKPQP